MPMPFGSSFDQAEIAYRRERILAAYRQRRTSDVASPPSDSTGATSRAARRPRSGDAARHRR
jgi:hypothetical protein